MSVYIKNTSGAEKTVRGHVLADNAYLLISESERSDWGEDSTVFDDISNDDVLIAKDDSGSNDISDHTEQWAYLKSAIPDGVNVTNTKIQIYDEFNSSEKIPKFACATGTFSSNICVLEIKCPGTFPAVGRYLKDGYAFTDAYYFGDRIAKLEVVDKDNLLGYGAGTVVKQYHDESVATANQGWFLWAGEGGIGEIDLENAGGWGEFIAGLYLRATFEKDASSTATKGAINIFWADNEA